MSLSPPSRTMPVEGTVPHVLSHRSYRRRRAWRRHREGFVARWTPIQARLQAVPLPFWSGVIVGVLTGMLVMGLAMKSSPAVLPSGHAPVVVRTVPWRSRGAG